ncbi:hypothetical protein [Microbacterium sp. NPDC058389]|uniref:hypothetical protein n=1 Tax=Microbacterium sp. NPDC058389 TaxID=3346475 RepID=UPI00364C048E
MLLLGSRSITVEGITVFPDHADPDQFWYLPGPVRLAEREDGQKAFTFIQYRPAAVAAGVKGGGFLTFQVDLHLDKQLERRIVSKLRSVSKGTPRLTVVPFDEGTVQCVALNLQGEGGVAAQPAGPGSFNAVEQILGAGTPSLQGDNTAAFSLTLSQEGAIILRQAFEQGTTPVGVIYDLKFTGMRPALNVEITADLSRVYDQLSGGIEAQVYFVKAGIDAAFEKLVQDGAIKIKVVDFTGEDDEKEKERWALDFFKENLLRQWFEPTLAPGVISGGRPEPEPLSAVLQRGTAMRPPTTPAPPRPPAAPEAAPRTEASPAAGTGRGAASAGHTPTPPPPGTPADASPATGSGSPATSDTVAPAAAVGAPRVAPASTPATTPPAGLDQGAAAPAGGGGTPAVVSFRLRIVHQEERKTVKLVYDRSEATQRTYAPQGFFGVLVADLDRSKHFVEVDLDAPFFRVFEVQVDPPTDFAAIGLRTAQVSLDYGDPAQPATLKHHEVTFEAADTEPDVWQVFLDQGLDLGYRAGIQFHFDPASDWKGATFAYEVPPARTEDRSLVLNAHEHVGFLEVAVQANRVDWQVVDSIDVFLRHESGGKVQEEQLPLSKGAPGPVSWKVRTDVGARDYTYRLVHHLKDGTIKETTSREPSRAALLPVDDPFPGALTVTLVPLLDPATTRMAFVDIDYTDAANGYTRAERLTIQPTAVDPIDLSLALMDPQQRTYRYQVTVVGKDNKMTKLPPVETSDDLVAVQSQPTP